LTYIDKNIYWWIKGYNFYKSGMLPSGNGWLAQTNKFIESISFIEKLILDHSENENGK